MATYPNASSLSLDEKIRLVTGDGMWRTSSLGGKIESILLSDGPHGVRKEIDGNKYNLSQEATCFPTASCLACSWDKELVATMAKALGQEARDQNISILLGPGINMKRTPLCGRNFEYFSEDPYLSGSLATSYVEALESTGVGTSLKHFAGNNQESNRQTANSQIDLRALREIYLRAFEIVIKKTKPATIMNSYNRLNGQYTGASPWLLTDILRKEWGYEGAVISDWSATIDLPASIAAGLDLEMPDSLGIHGKDLKEAILQGKIKESDLDRAVDNILKLVQKYSHRQTASTGPDKAQDKVVNHHDLARRLAGEAAVLLKNEGQILPLSKEDQQGILVIGKLAEETRFQGGGSSHVNCRTGQNALEALKTAGFSLKYAAGYRTDSEKVDPDLENEALALCQRAAELKDKSAKSKVLFFGGLTEIIEGEGFDRKNLKLAANQEQLLNKILNVTDQVIFISYSGSAYEIPQVPRLKAILQMYLAGQAAGEAAIDLMTGRVNPSGKLAESWPKALEDIASTAYFDRTSKDLEYRESLFIGYRYFDSCGLAPLFPFGFGLSYTTFSYSDLKIEYPQLGHTMVDPDDRSEINLSESPALKVSLTVTNTGEREGQEIVQVYVRNPKSNFIRARRELRGFAKVRLKAGEKTQLTIDLDNKSFSVFNAEENRWQLSGGLYQIEVASSSAEQDIQLRQEFLLEAPCYDRDDRSYLAEFFKPLSQGSHLEISRETFEKLYAKPLSNFSSQGVGDFNLSSSLNDMAAHSRFARFIRWLVIQVIYRMFPGRNKEDPQVQMMVEGASSGPIDAVICQSGSRLMHKIGLITIAFANRKLFKS